MLIPAPFEVSLEDVEGVRVIVVRGELDLNTAPELEETLDGALADASQSIVINLADCEFIDSTGVALIVRAWQRTGDGNGTRLALCCPSSQVARLLEITGVEGSIPLHDDLEAAIADVGS